MYTSGSKAGDKEHQHQFPNSMLFLFDYPLPVRFFSVKGNAKLLALKSVALFSLHPISDAMVSVLTSSVVYLG